MNSLVVKDLCKTYIVNKRPNNVLRNVSMEVKQGEMVAIMGPSGSGKSTLLYTVSGMDKKNAGQIHFFGKDLDCFSEREMSDLRLSEMGFVFQQMHMLKNLSIYDNIVLPAFQLHGSKSRKKREMSRERAKELMQKLGIREIAENDINEVSGGQLQRACICRSLMNHPKIIFADEPTGALNQQTSKEVIHELIQISREGTSVLLVTHDMKVAAKSDRIIYIEDGTIKGDFFLGKFEHETEIKERERTVSSWLMEMGW